MLFAVTGVMVHFGIDARRGFVIRIVVHIRHMIVIVDPMYTLSLQRHQIFSWTGIGCSMTMILVTIDRGREKRLLRSNIADCLRLMVGSNINIVMNVSPTTNR